MSAIVTACATYFCPRNLVWVAILLPWLALAATSPATAAGLDVSQQNSPSGPVAGLYDPHNLGPNTTAVDTSPYAEIHYVSIATGSDTTGDGSAATPWQTAQYAMAQIGATSQTRRAALLVAGGNYTGSGGTSPAGSSGTVDTVLVVKGWVDVYGGFESTTWTRNIATHETIIDAEYVTNRRAVFMSSHSLFDGFTVRRGKLTGTNVYSAGVCCFNYSTVSNCIIKNNIINSSGWGGGVYCSGYSNAANCVIQGNSATISGGGIQCVTSSTVVNSIVVGNALPAAVSGGGGICLITSSAINCVVADNAIGAFAADGGGIRGVTNSRAINCVATGNSLTEVADGGGIYLNASRAINCYAAANSSSLYGSGDGFFCEVGASALNCIATGNKGGGGGSGSGGGGFCCTNGASIANCVATQNAHSGSYIGGVYNDQNTQGAVINTIIRDNTGPEYVYRTFSSAPDGAVVNCNIEGGWPTGQNTVDSDPQFVGAIASGAVSAIAYDAATSQSVLTVTGANSLGFDLTGWVVQIGGSLAVPTSCYYGVVASCTTNSLVVWGNATMRLDASGQRTVSIAAPANWQVYDYHLKSNSPMMGLGLGPDAGHTSATLVSRYDGDGQARVGSTCEIGPDEFYYTVTFLTDGTPGATLGGTTIQSVQPNGDCTSVTAVAPAWYHLIKWTANNADYSTSNPMTLKNVTTDTSVVAHFGLISAEITWTSNTLPFGSFDWQDGSTSATVTIFNSAAAGESLNCSLSLTGSFSTEFSIQNVSGTNPIVAGASLVRRIVWDPADAANIGQMRDVSLRIAHNDPSKTSPIVIPLNGTALPVELSSFCTE